MAKDKVVVGIDIGSSKICTIIAQVDKEGQISVIGVSTVESRGIKKGIVVDIDRAVEAIAESLEGAERMAGYTVSEAFILVGGKHIASLNSHGVVAISSPSGEISEDDVYRVTEAARAISIPSSREIIHVLPRNFIVDSQEDIHDPVGMSGVRLEVETHIISGSTTSIRNLVKCIQQVGVDVRDLVFSALASSEAVLTETEKELGVVLADIGGGTTDLAFFTEGSIAYSSVLPIGGKNITNDLAIGLRTSIEDAEKIKLFLSDKREPVYPSEVGEGKKEEKENKKEDKDKIDLSHLNLGELRDVSKKFLINGIIKPRLKEIMSLIGLEIKKSGLVGNLPAGIVLTGGSANAMGIIQVAKEVLNMPVRIGEPKGVGGLIDEVSSSAYAASIGLVIFGSESERAGRLPFVGGIKLRGVFEKAVNWFKSFIP